MYELTTAAMIWNRACGDDPLRALPGDRALADVLYAHGLAMNGGVLYAVECMTVEEQCDAEAGYRYYGLDGIATLLTRAREIFEAANDLGDYEQQEERLRRVAASANDDRSTPVRPVGRVGTEGPPPGLA